MEKRDISKEGISEGFFLVIEEPLNVWNEQLERGGINFLGGKPRKSRSR